MRNAVIRTDADPQIGFGHLHRCLSLAQAMLRADIKSDFVFKKASDQALILVDGAGFSVRQLPEGISLVQEAASLNPDTAVIDYLILDIAHGETARQADQLPDYLKLLKSKFHKTVFLDAGGSQALANSNDLTLDAVIRPYVGEEKTTDAGFMQLLGPSYFILNSEILAARRQCETLRTTAHRILITFGGSDPKDITLLCLDALTLIKNVVLEIQVIVGPGYSSELKQAISKAVAQSSHRIIVFDAPASLSENYAWADIALSGTGLTKYELAATGTPSIQISMDTEHAAINAVFSKAGTTRDLGTCAGLSCETITQTLENLISDLPLRQKMCENSHRLIDGNGANRVVEMMRKLN